MDNVSGAFDVSRRRRGLLAGILAIVVLVFVVYLPVLPGSFLMDDERLIGRDNPLVNGQLTPYTLWFRTDFTLATLGWRLEGLAFGNSPAGYHVVNILLQTISALLLWAVLARLKIPGAWLAAALFAVHPVCVNSVARIGELKNTLSLPFCLLSFFAYLQYEGTALYPPASTAPEGGKGNPLPAAGGAGRVPLIFGGIALPHGHCHPYNATLWYVVALAAFVLSLFAKTTAVMLPVIILICAAWQRRRLTWKDILHTSPFFVLSIAFGLMSVWFQRYQALPSTELTLQPETILERLAGAGYAFWFYLGKALLPVGLNLAYPRWTIDPGTWTAFVPDALGGALLLFCWQYRRGWGRHVLFGLASFAVMLFPALGFFDAQFLTVWRVSDHLQYMALTAILALAAAAVASLPAAAVFRWAACVLILSLSILSFKRAGVFSAPDRLMRDTLAKNPAAADAYNDLGAIYAARGNVPAAIHEFVLALAYDPQNADARMNLGHALAQQGKLAKAEEQYTDALKIRPFSPQLHKLFADLMEREGKNAQALYHLKKAVSLKPDSETHLEIASLCYKTGDPRQAVHELRAALAFKRDNATLAALNDLAWILATSPDASVRNGIEAIQLAQEACRLTASRQPLIVNTLAAAYAEAGRFPDAVATAKNAVDLAIKAGDMQLAARCRQLLMLYRSGRPFRDQPAAP